MINFNNSLIKVSECTESDELTWDTFVMKISGTYCHLFGWKRVFERAYNLRTRYLAFHYADAWLGILPVAIMPRVLGRELKSVSLPYCNYGGLLTAPGVDAEMLKLKGLRYLSDVGVSKVEFRDLAPGMADTEEVSMFLSLPASAELLWKQAGDKVRNQIRKAQRSELTLQWGTDQVDDLYSVYAINMGRLGTPVHSSKFVIEMIKNLGQYMDVLTVRHEERVVGAMLVIKFMDTWIDPIASSLAEFKAFNPNMLLYWEALRTACDAGARFFDFGRSHKDSGTYRFKKQWGAKEVSLNYHSYRNGFLLPSAYTTFYRSQNAVRLADMWSKLPNSIQLGLGPILRRWIP